MVFGGELDEDRMLASTYEEAQTNHKKMCDLIAFTLEHPAKKGLLKSLLKKSPN